MAETPRQDAQTQFAIQKIYVKDLSFETPNSPQVFLEKWEPDVNLQLSNTSAVLSDNTHEVVLSLTVTAKLGDKTAYLAEVQQAGIFNIEGYDETQLSAVIGSYCPHVLFPYAREAVSDLVTRGGFPQLLLAPLNFDALYRQHLEQGQQEQAGDSKH
jgi:preprotein translocase subunit SecB